MMARQAPWLESVRRTARSLGSGRRELAIALIAYGLYSLVRGLFGGEMTKAQENAADLIDLEQRLGIYVERDIQNFFVDHHLAMPFWNFFYPASQVVVLPLTLFLVYRYRRSAYPFIRNLAILSWCGGLVWYALQPTAPPRLAGAATDTVTQQTFFDLASPVHPGLLQPRRGDAQPARRARPGGGLGALAAHHPLADPRARARCTRSWWRRRSSSPATTTCSTSPAGSRSCSRPPLSRGTSPGPRRCRIARSASPGCRRDCGRRYAGACTDRARYETRWDWRSAARCASKRRTSSWGRATPENRKLASFASVPAVSKSTVPTPSMRSSRLCDVLMFCTRSISVDCSRRDSMPRRMRMRWFGHDVVDRGPAEHVDRR